MRTSTHTHTHTHTDTNVRTHTYIQTNTDTHTITHTHTFNHHSQWTKIMTLSFFLSFYLCLSYLFTLLLPLCRRCIPIKSLAWAHARSATKRRWDLTNTHTHVLCTRFQTKTWDVYILVPRAEKCLGESQNAWSELFLRKKNKIK